MTGYVVLLFVSIGGLVLSWLRYDAGRKRRETTARLAAEAGDAIASPTEELFRSEGIPVSEAMRQGLATAPPPPPASQKIGPMLQAAALSAREGLGQLRLPANSLTAPQTDRSDLDALVSGVELPCALAPLVEADAPAGDAAVFVTALEHRGELHDELHTSFARIGCSVRWIDDSTASIRRGPYSGEVTIEALPERPDLVAVRVAST
jgi:hypothetical protein